MKQLSGKAVSPGYAKGTALVYSQCRTDEVPRYKVTDADVAEEHRRFFEAVERSHRELKQLENRVLAELGEAQSAIFAAHLGLLQDNHFAERIKARIQGDLVNVEHALDVEVADLCAMLASVENEYLRERAQDIRDVGRRVMRQLTAHDGGQYVDVPPQSVIVARELLPSETLDLDREHVAGIVTEEGGENSHAAILARALGIPAVTGIANATSNIPAGAQVLVDGESGIVSMMPSEAAMADFARLKSRYDDDTSAAVAAESLDCVTPDGTRVSLLANINRPHEASLVTAHHLDGIGLFRTEFMFVESTVAPSFERQVAAYRQIVEAIANRPAVIRTLDLGGDKMPAFLEPQREANPNLGSRGLRFSLAEQTLFQTQIRAIITASQGHENVRLLLPMVLGAGDLAEAAELVRMMSCRSRCRRPAQDRRDDRDPRGALRAGRYLSDRRLCVHRNQRSDPVYAGCRPERLRACGGLLRTSSEHLAGSRKRGRGGSQSQSRSLRVWRGSELCQDGMPAGRTWRETAQHESTACGTRPLYVAQDTCLTP